MIDERALPLVKYFNSQGLTTEMSCQGHNNTNMSMFWISFNQFITEKDIINFQKRHLKTQYKTFSSCGRFAQRLYIGGPTIIKQWHYFAANPLAAEEDLRQWLVDDNYNFKKETQNG